MYDFLSYNLKTGACLAVFYLFYKVLLSRETFHRFNRLLILAAVAASFLLPLCVISVYREIPRPEPLPFPIDPIAVQVTEPAEVFPWEETVGILFLFGVAAVLCWTAVSLWRVVRLIRTGRHLPLDDRAELVLHKRELTPFSWLRYIVLSERDYRENGPSILTHERAHIALFHSVDLLLTDLLSCLQWFNPAMWLLRQELRSIHEYEADEAVLRSGADAREYQMLLIKKAAGERWYSVANSFNHSKLKNRITMMLRKRSSRWAGAKALFVLPLLGVALGAFAETVYVYPTDKGSEKTDQKQIQTVVVSGGSASETRSGMNFSSVTVKPSGDVSAEQSGKVTLRVVDAATKEPLIGAVVRIDGTTGGAVTNPQGEAELTVQEGDVVNISMVDYPAFQMTVSGLKEGSLVEVALSASTETPRMEEIVVVAYGDDKGKSDSSIPPLYLVNGQPVEDLNSIDASSIAGMSVYKDAATIEKYVKLYGERAQNGVVVITLRGEGAVSRNPGYIKIHGNGVQFDENGVTFLGTGNPLYLIDGKEAGREAVAALNPADILGMEACSGRDARKKFGKTNRDGVINIVLKPRKAASADASEGKKNERGGLKGTVSTIRIDRSGKGCFRLQNVHRGRPDGRGRRGGHNRSGGYPLHGRLQERGGADEVRRRFRSERGRHSDPKSSAGGVGRLISPYSDHKR